LETEVLNWLYSQMLRIRTVEERICELYKDQEMRCPIHMCIGQEAVPVGVCAHLTEDDYVLSGHRSHGHYLAKGGDLNALVAELYGKATGCSGGMGGSMHLVDLGAGFLAATPILGSTVPIAVGSALASVMRREHRVTVAFFGDAVAEEGVLCESLNFALLKNLPVVFVCENNGYSVYSPLSVRQPASREIYEIAAGHGLESYQGDGNDVVQVFDMARKAVDKARNGEGPTFLEFKTYRWREHCGPNYDNDLGYRTEEECREWMNRCPIVSFREQHLWNGAFSPEELESVALGIEMEFQRAVRFARDSPFPKEEDLLSGVYAE